MRVPEPGLEKNSPVSGDERQVERELSLRLSAAEGCRGDLLQILAGREVRGRGRFRMEKQRRLKAQSRRGALFLKCTKLADLPVTTGEGWKGTGALPRPALIRLYLGTGEGRAAGTGPCSRPGPRNRSGGVREQQDNIRHFSRS